VIDLLRSSIVAIWHLLSCGSTKGRKNFSRTDAEAGSVNECGESTFATFLQDSDYLLNQDIEEWLLHPVRNKTLEGKEVFLILELDGKTWAVVVIVFGHRSSLR
jgi:hypothetical protein